MSGGLGNVRPSHNDWYKREVERGRRFHGAFSGGFSAGYFNSVGSEKGWTPSQFSSSRSSRAEHREQTAADIGDEDDVFGEVVASNSYEETDSRSRAMLRLLRRRKKAGLAWKGVEDLGGGEDDIVQPPHIPIKTDRHCIGYAGGVTSTASAYRISDATKKRSRSLLSLQSSSSGFAIADDEDDVYSSGGPSNALMVIEEDEDEEVPSRSNFSSARSSRLMIGGSGPVKTGAGMPGFRRAIRSAAASISAKLPDPPRGWRWTEASVVRRKEESPWKSVARPSATRVMPTNFDDLKSAMSNRFTSSHKEVLAPSTRSGLSQPQPSKEFAEAKKPPPIVEEPKKVIPSAPTRISRSWQPLPLLCKRFGLPMPTVDPSVDVATLRERQFSTNRNAGGVTTATTGSNLFDKTIGKFIGSRRDEEEEGKELPNVPTNPLPARPNIDLFKSIFETDDDDSARRGKRQAPAENTAKREENSGHVDLFANLLAKTADDDRRRRRSSSPEEDDDDDDDGRRRSKKKKHKKSSKKKKKHRKH